MVGDLALDRGTVMPSDYMENRKEFDEKGGMRYVTGDCWSSCGCDNCLFSWNSSWKVHRTKSKRSPVLRKLRDLFDQTVIWGLNRLSVAPLYKYISTMFLPIQYVFSKKCFWTNQVIRTEANVKSTLILIICINMIQLVINSSKQFT